MNTGLTFVVELLKKYWLLIVGVVTAISTALKFGAFVTWMRAWMTEDLEKVTDNRYWLSVGRGWTAATLFVLLIAALILAAIASRDAFRQRRAAMQLNDPLRRSLRGTRDAATRIVGQLYPIAERPPFVFDEAERILAIGENGDATLTVTSHIRASDRPLHFWNVFIDAEPEANAATFLDDIGFKVWENDGDVDRVAYLVTRDESREKKAAVFFLPHIAVGEAARRITYEVHWPGLMAKLVNSGEEDYHLMLDSHGRVGKLALEVYASPRLTKKLDLIMTKVSAAIPGESLLPGRLPKVNWKGWKYRAENVVADGSRCEFVLRLVKRAAN